MSIESGGDLTGLMRAGKVVSLTLREMQRYLRPGMTTGELDAVGAEVLERHGARSAPRLIYDFPGTTLISLNDEAIHGIPGERVIQAGGLVKIDVTAELDGYIHLLASRQIPVHYDVAEFEEDLKTLQELKR